MEKIKRPVMNLELTLGGQKKTFKTPYAEDILAQVKAIEKRSAGTDLVRWYDKETKSFVAQTFCCGDGYVTTFDTEEVNLRDTDVDCYGYPITYIGDDEQSTTTVKNGVVKVSIVKYQGYDGGAFVERTETTRLQ